MDNEEYEYEVSGDSAEIAALFEAVADGLRAGSVRVGDDDDAVTVATPEDLDLEVELEREDDEMSLELEVEWPVEGDDAGISAVDESTEESAEETPEEDEGLLGEEDGPEPVVTVPAGPQSLARFEVFEDAAAEYRWRLVHRNGNVIATGGEGYTRKHNALKGLRSVMQNAPEAEVTDEFAE